MTKKDWDLIATGIVEVCKRALAQPMATVTNLEARVVALEARPKGLSYLGTWQRAASYERHQGATHKGVLWVCVADATRAEPGTSGDWQLAEKAAR